MSSELFLPVMQIVPGTASPTAEVYRKLARAAEANLQQDIVGVWFPRAVDREKGGFYQNFADDWTRKPTTGKAIVYQSRLLWVASQMALRDATHREEFLKYVRHGVSFLSQSLWDKEKGGLFWTVDNENHPAYNGDKHSYGIAFGIYALSAAYRATKDAATLDLAKRTFVWLDTHAHDAKNGGYFEALSRNGHPQQIGEVSGNDFIGTVVGQKSMNTHIHLLEALSSLQEVWPDATVKARLRELFLIVRDRIATEDGHLEMFFLPDWKPTGHEDSYGHDIETAYLLLEAAEATGLKHDVQTATVARRLVDHVLTVGRDTTAGGYYDSGPAHAAATVKDKIWWTQAEALNALLLLHAEPGTKTERYWTEFLRQWDFIANHQIDRQHRGWYPTVNANGSPIPGQGKSDAWTDPYHQGRAMMNVADTLHRLANGDSDVHKG